MWLGFSTLLISAVSAAQLAPAIPESVSRFLAANRQFRWSGSAYESGIRLPGETVCINSGSEILARPNANTHKRNPIRPEVIGYIDSDNFVNDFGC